MSFTDSIEGGKCMRETTRTWVQGVAVVCFVVGMMVFLNETRSTGEALQTFKLIISTSTLSIIGAALALVAAVMFGVLFLLERKQRQKSQQHG